jgi:hypothetical protein
MAVPGLCLGFGLGLGLGFGWPSLAAAWDGGIPIRKTIARATLGLALVLGLNAAATRPAEASRDGSLAAGVAVGTLLGLGIAGAYVGPRSFYRPSYPYGPAYFGPGCYPGPQQCGWAGRSCWRNPYGEMVCRGGEWRCWRPAICE